MEAGDCGRALCPASKGQETACWLGNAGPEKNPCVEETASREFGGRHERRRFWAGPPWFGTEVFGKPVDPPLNPGNSGYGTKAGRALGPAGGRLEKKPGQGEIVEFNPLREKILFRGKQIPADARFQAFQ